MTKLLLLPILVLFCFLSYQCGKRIARTNKKKNIFFMAGIIVSWIIAVLFLLGGN